MNKLNSLSLFVGTGECNANCKHCAGKIHRKYAHKKDGIIDEELINQTLRECYQKGARHLSISSSGEPTLSPLAITKTLELIHTFGEKGKRYSPVNLYSNGIKIGEDENFCKEYLSKWGDLNLTTVYVTVHDTDEENNARIYGVKEYPCLETIFSRIHCAGLKIRANLVLSQKNIATYERFISIVKGLEERGIDSISAWPIRGKDDKLDLKLSPLEEELDKIDKWIQEKNMHHRIRLLREKSRIAYQENKKLTLFPDGTLSSSWCNG